MSPTAEIFDACLARIAAKPSTRGNFRTDTSYPSIETINQPRTATWKGRELERFFRSLREECLDRMIFFGEQSLLSVVQSYYYHAERNHQGLANKIIDLVRKSIAVKVRSNAANRSVACSGTTIATRLEAPFRN